MGLKQNKTNSSPRFLKIKLLYFQELVLTASGDGTAHIWQCAVHLTNESSSGRMASSEDELDPLERESQAFGKILMHFQHDAIAFSVIQV